jgi:thiol peroxidase
MATVMFKGKPTELAGTLPTLGSQAPDFTLTAADLSEVNLASFTGKKVVLNIFPSVDTPVCAASVRHFNEAASSHPDTVVLCISADLPFAQARFCSAEGLKHVKALSTFHSPRFSQDYGVKIDSGPLAGLNARAVIVLDPEGKVKYTELVPEVSNEPDYDKALAAL